ncbi:hypothetical protein SDC9_133706 [bioreactor metagenome]|uniref:Uncharacterized protein n=1 Tax=bioreactor metagenome TaxID=1076179 RepID=A0A645DB06_9ZZZZ
MLISDVGVEKEISVPTPGENTFTKNTPKKEAINVVKT